MNERTRILLTGFEPFAGDQINPSWEVAKALNGEHIDKARILAARLPCIFGKAQRAMDLLLAQHRPSLVLALGLAGGRRAIGLERVAINVDDARIADNSGAQPVDLPVIKDAPAAYFSTLPIKAMAAALRAAGYPAEVSNSAGTFVCNHLFFSLQHSLRKSKTRSGFMHLPYLPEQAARLVNQPSMALEAMVEATRIALQSAWRTSVDIRQEGGTLD
jgi:pyroglutamyl-peptidase